MMTATENGNVMKTEVPKVSVCVCTLRRAHLLPRLLKLIAGQETGGRFSVEVVVVDNDASGSSRETVESAAADIEAPVTYCIEPEQNIAKARNRALAEADGAYVAFIDDDEVPPGSWLRTMFAACRPSGVAGVLGPVKPLYEEPPPQWVVAGKFYDRHVHETGHVMEWTNCRTGNVLMRRRIIPADEPPFREEFGSGGEDRDFFRRMIARGHKFVWCNEAAVSEIIPASRWKRSFLLRRALLRGRASFARRKGRVKRLLISLTAIPVYALLLPVALLAGQHRFMKYSVRLCDHCGRVLAALGINPVREVYLSQ